MKGAIFNVGPLTNSYAGPHTYADVLFPFVKELTRRGVELTWVGITLENHITHEKLTELQILPEPYTQMSIENDIKPMSVSWDFLNANDFDFLLCQPRPDTNKLENQILFALINKFLDAGKKVFVWEQDMYTAEFTDRMREEVIFLHPALIPTGNFKNEIFFPFFTYTYPNTAESERTLDFVFLGNIYFRHAQALQFFSQLNNSSFKKLVFGSWIADEERRKFSSQFDNFEFAGSCEHWAAIPTMKRAKATLHIVPDFAKIRGLMTARVFTSQMARCLCFCDAEIIGAEQFFPPELIVKDGNDLISKWNYAQEHREELLAKRDELLKEHTVEHRVEQFLNLLNE